MSCRWWHRLETTPKLFTLTFVLVAFSAKDATSESLTVPPQIGAVHPLTAMQGLEGEQTQQLLRVLHQAAHARPPKQLASCVYLHGIEAAR